MKAISAAMTTHINRRVITLATCWVVTRQDGTVLRITDHDRDISFGGDTYDAATGISRTAIESKADLAVDNLEVIGFLSGLIDEADLRDGIYDFAQIEVFSVNWQDPDGHGKIEHRTGNLGDVGISDIGYKAELRGLLQVIDRRRGKVYTPDCRADLYSALINPSTGRADGCGIAAASFQEAGIVQTVTSNRKFVTEEFIEFNQNPVSLLGAANVIDQRRVTVGIDGSLRMCLDITDKKPMRPSIITTGAALAAIEGGDMYGHYVLGNDIDLTGFGNWTPIGDDTRPFAGVFDGMGYSIINLSCVNGSAPAGLFGTVTGQVKRVTLVEPTIESGASNQWAGAIAARTVGNDAGNHPLRGASQIARCNVLGGLLTTNGDQAGGIVGEHDVGSVITVCVCAIELSGSIGTLVGAIIGDSSAGDTPFTDIFWNSDAAGTTDPGNGVGGGQTDLFDSGWTTQGNYSSAFDFNDLYVMMAGAFADGGGDLTFATPANTVTRTTGSWLDDEYRSHENATFSGTVSNNGTFRVRGVTATVLTLDSGETIAAEVIAGSSVTGTTAGAAGHMNPGRFG